MGKLELICVVFRECSGKLAKSHNAQEFNTPKFKLRGQRSHSVFLLICIFMEVPLFTSPREVYLAMSLLKKSAYLLNLFTIELVV